MEILADCTRAWANIKYEFGLELIKNEQNFNQFVFEFFKDAEELHKRAISIKSDLLGPYDYEVGLSIGHLASLYSYHMKKFREAEQLYLKSIAISKYPKWLKFGIFTR